MNHRGMQFYAENATWYESVRLYMRQKLVDGYAIAETVMMREVESTEIDEPFLTMDRESAQTLMDALWDCGLRPSEGQGSAGQLKAVQYHLEDMRKLVFREEAV